MKNFKEMSDYELCQNLGVSSSIKELWDRYQNLIFKYAHTFHKDIGKTVPIEDLIQDFNVLFFTAIYKIDLNRIKNKDQFKIIIFVPYFFQAYQKVLYHHYRYEMNTSIDTAPNFFYGEYTEEGEEFYANDYDSENESFNLNSAIMDKDYSFIYSLEKILEPLEYEIVYKFYICKIKKKFIAEDMNVSVNYINNKLEQILYKLKKILTPEKRLLMS